MLFIIYMKPLVRPSGILLQWHQYADDPQLYCKIASDPKRAVVTLNWHLEGVMGRISAINRLNLDKSKVLLIGPSLVLGSICTPVLSVVALTPKVFVQNLGILLDPGLLLDVQVMAMVMNVYYKLWLVSQLRHFLNKNELNMVTSALVMSLLDYCSTFYMGLHLKTTWKLQLCQNATAQTLIEITRYHHVTPDVQKLWLLLVF